MLPSPMGLAASSALPSLDVLLLSCNLGDAHMSSRKLHWHVRWRGVCLIHISVLYQVADSIPPAPIQGHRYFDGLNYISRIGQKRTEAVVWATPSPLWGDPRRMLPCYQGRMPKNRMIGHVLSGEDHTKSSSCDFRPRIIT